MHSIEIVLQILNFDLPRLAICGARCLMTGQGASHSSQSAMRSGGYTIILND